MLPRQSTTYNEFYVSILHVLRGAENYNFHLLISVRGDQSADGETHLSRFVFVEGCALPEGPTNCKLLMLGVKRKVILR